MTLTDIERLEALAEKAHRVRMDFLMPHPEADDTFSMAKDTILAICALARRGLASPRGEAVAMEQDNPRYDQSTGLYQKFRVERTNGSSGPGGKHEDCEYFVLDLTHDKHAYAAIDAYALSCADDFPALSNDLRDIAHEMATRKESK